MEGGHRPAGTLQRRDLGAMMARSSRELEKWCFSILSGCPISHWELKLLGNKRCKRSIFLHVADIFQGIGWPWNSFFVTEMCPLHCVFHNLHCTESEINNVTTPVAAQPEWLRMRKNSRKTGTAWTVPEMKTRAKKVQTLRCESCFKKVPTKWANSLLPQGWHIQVPPLEVALFPQGGGGN